MDERVSLLQLFCLAFLLVPTAFGSRQTANPFTPGASALRYWDQTIQNNIAKPQFILNKLSPLSSTQWAILQNLSNHNALNTQLFSFCFWARLFCLPSTSPLLSKTNDNTQFSEYVNRNFSNIGSHQLGGMGSFKNYSEEQNIAADSFTRYSRDALNRTDDFQSYSRDGNVISSTFSGYAVSGLGSKEDFTNYANSVNVPDIKFTDTNTGSVGNSGSFTSYSADANHGDQSFKSYNKASNGVHTSFTSYGNNSNVMASAFSGYGESGNSANDSFKSYASNGNVPENSFIGYGIRENGGVHFFSSYREDANVGDDTFTSYLKNSNAGQASFSSYGLSFNEGMDKFKGYGNRAFDQHIGFTIYSENSTFKDYEKKETISFSKYKSVHSGISSNSWRVEEGKFFRESKLKQGHQMKMPDISDKMPPRSFLPRSLAKKIPFSMGQIGDLLNIFKSDDNSTMADIVGKTLKECERAPSRGESKRCVASLEDMIDFAVQALGRNITVRSTEGLGGSNSTVEIGEVKGMNGGKITKSVSCHQSLFPNLVYYCHSVPKVRVYQVDVVDSETKKMINRGVAICHIDTFAWGSTHAAFRALGGKPGQIEVCHWIYENDMTWVVAD